MLQGAPARVIQVPKLMSRRRRWPGAADILVTALAVASAGRVLPASGALQALPGAQWSAHLFRRLSPWPSPPAIPSSD
jgi:hypothetical protein